MSLPANVQAQERTQRYLNRLARLNLTPPAEVEAQCRAHEANLSDFGPDDQVELTAILTPWTSEIQLARKSVRLFTLAKTPISLAIWLPGLAYVFLLLKTFRLPVQYRAPYQLLLPIHLPFIPAIPPSIHTILLPLLSLTSMIPPLTCKDISVKPVL
ncbi:hypothetical protein B0H13DRAFT_2357017 [Mycena leptocephala]|nr:hypothetical protein B0H13DRAFT_2357017 [Mycena leptocephala]